MSVRREELVAAGDGGSGIGRPRAFELGALCGSAEGVLEVEPG